MSRGFPPSLQRQLGDAVAQRLGCSPPPRRIRFDPRSGDSRIFASGNRAGQCRWSAGFLGYLLFFPHLYSGTVPFSLNSTLIVSQDTVVKLSQLEVVAMCVGTRVCVGERRRHVVCTVGPMLLWPVTLGLLSVTTNSSRPLQPGIAHAPFSRTTSSYEHQLRAGCTNIAPDPRSNDLSSETESSLIFVPNVKVLHQRNFMILDLRYVELGQIDVSVLAMLWRLPYLSTGSGSACGPTVMSGERVGHVMASPLPIHWFGKCMSRCRRTEAGPVLLKLHRFASV
ncbi:hypothetical protein PR048_000013 [Dryococelus australis]|uniref:Uncharacterized protein n=1 Tax=Dryococelus australis TaxID=614101 RepID=A0ABQ9IDK9_9NEOP|nr:hypothetical protein PR048_000013 [Dryococelus australis]